MLIRRIRINPWLQLRKFSALHLTGERAKEEYAPIHPYLDFKSILGDRKELEENLLKRNSPINLNKIYNQWEEYNKLQDKKYSLEQRRIEITQILNAKDAKVQQEEAEKLRQEAKDIRNELKDLRENSYNFEEEFIDKFLEIPNKIHPREGIIFENSKDNETPQSSDLIKTVDEQCHYFRGELARFDFIFPHYCQKFLAQRGYEYFSNPDFVRTVIAEAAGIDKKTIFRVLEDDAESKINLLHLSGGGSMMSFLGYMARLSIASTQLPLAFVANGRTYSRNGNMRNQGNSVQTFCATLTQKEAEEKFDELIEDLKGIYERLKLHFRIVYAAPGELEASEMMRASLELFSNAQEAYREVASVSLHGDYLSKRLLFNCKTGKETHFPHVVTATIVNTSPLISILNEKHKNRIVELLDILK